jgi:transposase
MLSNKPRGVPRVNDRRVLNGISWVLRMTGSQANFISPEVRNHVARGSPLRDLPDRFGPYTTCYNRFVRWRQAGVWDEIMNALAGAREAAVQMK